jgi:hypothetical protein
MAGNLAVLASINCLFFTLAMREAVGYHLLSSFLGASLKKWNKLPRRTASKSARAILTRTVITMMPEGPEVRTLVDQLQGGVGRRLLDFKFVSGRYVRGDKPDGFHEFASTMTPYSELDGKASVDIITSWKAKGKFIYICLDDGANDTETQNDDFQRSM